MDSQMKTQLFSNPRVLGTVAGAVFLFSIVPGMPTLPFLMLGAGLMVATIVVNKGIKTAALSNSNEEEEAIEEKEEKVEGYLQVDPVEVEIGYGLIALVDDSQGGNLFQKISSTRKFVALEFGVLVPPVRVRDNLQLRPNEYIIKIKGNVVAHYEIYADRFLAMNSGNTNEKLSGIPTTDPAFGLEGYWISDQEKDKAELLGYTVVDSVSVLSTHLQETIKKNFDKILTRQSVKQLLENLKEEYPAVIEDINPENLPLGTIQKVLQSLLKELLPIKDLVQILESLIDYSKVTKNIEVLTEYVRHSLGDTIATLYKDSNNIIHAAAIGEQLEEYITNSLSQQGDATQTLGLTPEMLSTLNVAISDETEKFKNLGFMPILITSATIRPYLFRLINTTFPDVAILSFTELPANIEIEFIGKLEV